MGNSLAGGALATRTDKELPLHGRGDNVVANEEIEMCKNTQQFQKDFFFFSSLILILTTTILEFYFQRSCLPTARPREQQKAPGAGCPQITPSQPRAHEPKAGTGLVGSVAQTQAGSLPLQHLPQQVFLSKTTLFHLDLCLTPACPNADLQRVHATF